MENANEQINEMLKGLAGKEVPEGLKVSAWVTGGIYGKGVYEIHGKNGFAGYLRISPLKEKGLVKRIDHTKKINEWLNTEEGRAYFSKNRRTNLFG